MLKLPQIVVALHSLEDEELIRIYNMYCDAYQPICRLYKKEEFDQVFKDYSFYEVGRLLSHSRNFDPEVHPYFCLVYVDGELLKIKGVNLKNISFSDETYWKLADFIFEENIATGITEINDILEEE